MGFDIEAIIGDGIHQAASVAATDRHDLRLWT